jgi:hypothetical protein
MPAARAAQQEPEPEQAEVEAPALTIEDVARVLDALIARLEPTETATPDPAPAHASLTEAWQAAQAQAPEIVKSATATVRGESKGSGKAFEYTYDYSDLAIVAKGCRPVLARHGLLWTTLPGRDEKDRHVLNCTMHHVASDESETFAMPLLCDNTNDPKVYGSALTYMRRYSIVAALNIAPEGEDDDGDKATAAATRAPAQARRGQAREPDAGRAPPAVQVAPEDEIAKILDIQDDLHDMRLAAHKGMELCGFDAPKRLNWLRSKTDAEGLQYIVGSAQAMLDTAAANAEADQASAAAEAAQT